MIELKGLCVKIASILSDGEFKEELTDGPKRFIEDITKDMI